jgi:hypothetical protein
MRKILSVLALICCCFWMTAAQATVQIDIDLTRQSMNVTSNSGNYTWPISSARSGYVTPNGSFTPYSLQTMHYSKKYHMSPMPHSIFFAGGYAIHGSYSVRELGRPASHGCIRLSPGNAAALFQMVKSEGASIKISGTPPPSTKFANERRHHTVKHYAKMHRLYHHNYASDPFYQSERPDMAYAPGAHRYQNFRSWQADPYYHW